MKTSQPLNIRQFNKLRDRPGYYVDIKLQQEIQKVAEPDLASRLGKWKLINVRKHGEDLTIEVMINERDQSMQSLTKHANETLVFREHGKVKDSTPNFNRRRAWEDQLENWAQNEILKATFNILDRETLRREILNPYAFLQSYITNLATFIVKDAMIPLTDKEVRDWPINVRPGKVSYDNLRRSANEIVRKRFVDPQIRKLANHLFNPAKITDYTLVSHYNTTLLNMDIFQELTESSIHVLRYYCRNITSRHPKPVRLKHPGQVIEAVKDDLKLTPAQWKYFCRIPHPTMEEAERENCIQAKRVSMQALVEANQPLASEEQLRSIAWQTELEHFPNDPDQQNRNPMWRAWINLIHRYLGRFKDPEEDQDMKKFERVVDAINGLLESGVPWGPGDWDTLWRRSESWHRKIQEETNEKHDPQTEEAVWTSYVPTTTIDLYEFEPVTNGKDLINLSNRMNNCLHSYWRRCLEGNDRIFTVRPKENDTPTHPFQRDTILAAVQLRREGQAWRTGQIEGPSQQTFPDGVRKAAEILTKSYQEAHKKEAYKKELEHPRLPTKPQSNQKLLA